MTDKALRRHKGCVSWLAEVSPKFEFIDVAIGIDTRRSGERHVAKKKKR